jgi:hypothetical protein
LRVPVIALLNNVVVPLIENAITADNAVNSGAIRRAVDWVIDNIPALLDLTSTRAAISIICIPVVTFFGRGIKHPVATRILSRFS